jgi:iron complex transport system ATP-binding protein
MISVSVLRVESPESRVLDGIDLELSSGRVLGVYGPNGSGKSSLLRVLAGESRLPVEGGVRIDGATVGPGLSPAERCRKVLRLGSEFHSPFGVRVRELFELALEARHGPGSGSRIQERIATIAETLGILDLLSRDFETLSDGQKQWVMFGRGLLQEPSVLLLDETFSKLDLDRLIRARDLIRERTAAGATFVMVSHDLHFLTSVSDELLFLKSGRILARGAAHALLSTSVFEALFPGASLRILIDPVTGERRVLY